ncbi:hypothetical protein J1N35_029814 [Gossypium stocksii]|uniref:DUF4283 domain-containing protein n=1 Tax=Gossypium stocksii TaxID=47602 RepID=A0A9D3UZF7_9ROSI|nr:hypothetical protein J1N35_029814 [Gossypium stocksii]
MFSRGCAILCEILMERGLEDLSLMEGAPRTFNNLLLIFYRIHENEDPMAVSLVFSDWWVQIYDLPPGFIKESITVQFGNFIGDVVVFLMVLIYLRRGLRGLSIGWNGGHLVTLNSLSNNHIDVEIQEKEGNPKWRFTSFYGALDVRDKTMMWDLLRRLGSNNLLLWLVGGDFNDILFANKKQGGSQGMRLEWRLSVELWKNVSWRTLVILVLGSLGKEVELWTTI